LSFCHAGLVGLIIGLGRAGLVAQATSSASGQVSPAAATNEVIRLPEVLVTGRQEGPIGVAASAAQGTVGAAQIQERPMLRSGEILETVPGVIITQHAGGGKANQYFLRGFNLDHGTDFAVFLDGMPLNLPSHAHGEGYSDMNTVIPEFVPRVDYEKGPYYAEVGNYGSAGAAQLVFYKTLPQDFVTVEGGMFGYERGGFGASQKLGSGNLLYGGEASHDDGPWAHPDNQRWRVFAEFLNLFGSRDHDVDYAYVSRVTPTAAPSFQDVFHPVEPFQARIGLKATF